MTFSFYQSLRTVPRDLEEATRNFRFSGWQRFWQLEVPFAMPGLVWNMMMSMSGGWFFVVASEAIIVGDKTIVLPGIGSYLAAAIAARDLGRRRLGDTGDDAGDRALRSAHVPSARRVGGQVPLRADGGAERARNPGFSISCAAAVCSARSATGFGRLAACARADARAGTRATRGEARLLPAAPTGSSMPHGSDWSR